MSCSSNVKLQQSISFKVEQASLYEHGANGGNCNGARARDRVAASDELNENGREKLKMIS